MSDWFETPGRTNLLWREMTVTNMNKEHIVNGLETLGNQHASELKILKAEYQRRTKALLQVEEEEKKRIAREIHDDLSQQLTALKINLSLLERRISKGDRQLIEKVKQILELTDSLTGAVKRISLELRPGVLDDLGLTAAIELQVGDFRERTGIKGELESEPADITLNKQLSIAIFRILQKVLTNIAEQANATRVRISLKLGADKLHLKIIDNGERIKEEQILDRESFGLIEIGERADLFGGEVKIMSNPDKGTTLTVNIPLV